MKKTHLVYVLSDAPELVTMPLETALTGGSRHHFKVIAPKIVYPTDFAEADFVLIDYQFYEKNKKMFQPAVNFNEKIGIYVTLTDHDQWNDIIRDSKMHHFFGTSGVKLATEYMQYLNAMVDGKFWTAETFLTKPFTSHSRTEIRTSENLDQQIENVIAHHDLSDSFKEFKPILTTILNETLTNALYNAPVDAHGNFLYQSSDRKTVVHADENRPPVVEITEDAEKMVISVKDFYGTLKKEVIEHYLTSGKIAEKDGGAGVGIYLVMKQAHEMVVNIDPGIMTEFMIIVHKFKRFYHYQGLEKSFHYFQRKPL